ncbi:MAG: PIN domain-containing protein [Rubrivivax sp.]
MNTCVVVLDTHVVLDWLWFGDARLAALAAAVQNGRLQWVATDAMRQELHRVLLRPVLPPRGRSPEEVLRDFDRWARPGEGAPQAPPTASATWAIAAGALRCTDPDDQKFIDLALAYRAAWLFSRDRAVLRLARQARRLGCVFAPPEAWTPDGGPADAPAER